MVLVPIRCPHCGSENVVKNGHYANGKQRYMCRNAECPHSVFVNNYTYNACDPKIKEEILKMTVNGNGTRAIARILEISPNTVTATLKKKKIGHCKLTKIT
jgi:transposase-like protein